MFTYCLVTKGRRDYLPSTLKSLEGALLHADVQVVIIDNGCPDDISKMLINWCESSGKKTQYVRFDFNDPTAPRVWNILRDFNVDWVTFPGDDDIVCPEFLQNARDHIKRNKNIKAIGSSLRIIDSDGSFTGQERHPAKYLGDQIQYLADALHEPPFLFPGLFIKFNEITVPLPYSRYIFDWWLSLNLIVLGPIVTTSEISINYRVHDDQESALAPSRRKYFEALVVISRFLTDDNFENFLRKLSDVEKIQFLRVIASSGPIYGDSEFGRTLYFNLAVKIADSMSSYESYSLLMGELAASNGVLLREGELRSLLGPTHSVLQVARANFWLSFTEDSCKELLEYSKKFFQETPGVTSFLIGCRHSKKSVAYEVDCNVFKLNPESAIDLLVVQITEMLELEGKFDFKLSPIERALLMRLRSAKRMLPTGLIKRTKKKLMSGASK
jgi:hypothetical protein